MSSETDFAEVAAMLDRISEGGEGLSRFLPMILALAGEADEDQESTDRTTIQREIIIHPMNRRGLMIRLASGVDDSLNGDFPRKEGRSPASKASVESMPRVVIGDDHKEIGACSICLEEWLEGDEAAEMPCKHKFHSKCVEEWLGMHATCPLCRYEMPVEEEHEGKKFGVWTLTVNIGEGRSEDQGNDGEDGEGRSQSDVDSNPRDEAEY